MLNIVLFSIFLFLSLFLGISFVAKLIAKNTIEVLHIGLLSASITILTIIIYYL